MKFVDLYSQYLSIKADIDQAIETVIKESAFIRGRHVDEFERQFSNLLGIKHCVSCANGTDAIYIALRALGVRSGDEVVTTAHSWISTSETITQAGARVVFCDTEPDYRCIDPTQIEEKLTDRTKGIIVVHLYGLPADMDPILRIAHKYGLWVIEDCAQAHLASYKKQKVATFGDVSTFSFYPGKNLGAMGDAGCVVTNHREIADYAKLFARHGGKGSHQIEGINSRMDGLQAAILNAKMPYLKNWTEARQHIASTYDRLLAESNLVRAPSQRPDCTHVYHLYVINAIRRDELRAFLRQEGVPTQINYPQALPFCQAYKNLGHKPEDFPVAFKHMQEILSLPVFPEMQDKDVKFVSDKILEFEGRFN